MRRTIQHESNGTRPSSSSILLYRLKRQRTLIVATAVPLFLTLAIGTQFLGPTYKASATVLVEGRSPRPPVRGSETETPQPTLYAADVVGTEIAVLGSREIMSEVVHRLKLIEDPEFNPDLAPGWLSRTTSWARESLAHLLHTETGLAAEPERAWSDTVDTVIRSVKLTPLPRSRVIEITSFAGDRSLAAAISNMVADLYIATHLGLTREMNVDAQNFLTKRLEELRAASTTAAQALETYRVAHGLGTGATNTLLQEQMTALDAKLLDARTRLAALRAEYSAALAGSPEEMSSAVNSQTFARLRELEATSSSKLAEVVSRFGPQAPQVIPYQAMVTSMRQQVAAEATRRRQSLKNDVAAAEQTVAALTARAGELKAHLDEMDIARAHLDTLQAESAAAHNLYSAFLNRAKETDANLLFPTSDVRVISRATVPPRPWFPQNRLMLPAAAFLSLVAASCLGLVVDTRRKGMVSGVEVEKILGLSTLGSVPLRGCRTEGAYRDAIEDLLNRLYVGFGVRNVLVTSVSSGEGKSTIAHALASAATARGLRVLLIDADLRTPRRDSKSMHFGLSDVLRGTVAVQDVLRPNGEVMFLPAGRSHENPVQLFSLPPARHLLDGLTSRYDLVVFDGPPLATGRGDCWMLSQQVEHILVVVEWGSTPPGAVDTALKQVLDSKDIGVGRGPFAHPRPATIAGVVLNKVNLSRSRRFSADEALILE